MTAVLWPFHLARERGLRMLLAAWYHRGCALLERWFSGTFQHLRRNIGDSIETNLLRKPDFQIVLKELSRPILESTLTMAEKQKDMGDDARQKNAVFSRAFYGEKLAFCYCAKRFEYSGHTFWEWQQVKYWQQICWCSKWKAHESVQVDSLKTICSEWGTQGSRRSGVEESLSRKSVLSVLEVNL